MTSTYLANLIVIKKMNLRDLWANNVKQISFIKLNNDNQPRIPYTCPSYFPSKNEVPLWLENLQNKLKLN